MTERWLYAWALGSVAFGGASLLVPIYIVQLGATPVHLGYLAATAALVGAPGAIVFGRLAGTVAHRRELVLVTLVTVALALATIPLLTDVASIIVANAVLWLVVAAVAPVLTMLVVEDAPEPAWPERIGRLNTFQGYGWAGGLVVGSAWPAVGIGLVGSDAATRVLFWLLAACAVGSAAVAGRTLPDPSPGAGPPSSRRARRIGRLVATSRRGVKDATFVFPANRLYWLTRDLEVRRLAGRLDRDLATYLLAAALFFAGSAAFWAPLPLFLTTNGFATGGIFGLYLASSLASAVLYEPAGRVAARYGLRVVQSGALALRGLLFPALALGAALPTVALEPALAGVGLAAIGLTWAVIAVVGTAIVTRLAPARRRGEALGAYTAVAAVAGGVGAVLGGLLAAVGYVEAFAVAGGLVGLGAALVLAVGRLSGGAGDRDPAGETPEDDLPP